MTKFETFEKTEYIKPITFKGFKYKIKVDYKFWENQ